MFVKYAKPSGTAYQLFFAYVGCAALIGFIASWFLVRLSTKNNDA
jgi:hypothetical protein